MGLTEEQDEIVRAFAAGGNLRVVAYAGAGKTSTLVAMAARRSHRYAPGPGLYMAFNKAVATEAGPKFGARVQCRTAHSLAYRQIRSAGYSDDKMRTSLTARTCGPMPKIEDVDSSTFRQLVLGAVRRFCQSSDPTLEEWHVPKPAKPMEEMLWRNVRIHAARAASRLWNRAIDVSDPTPLGHDGYLKAWALQKPRLSSTYAYIMADEAQDLNPVLVGVLAAQECQTICVGDRHQQIYAWRGAVDALDILQGDICRLTQSFRFGGDVAERADALLRAMGETHALRGNGKAGRVSEPDCAATAVLCRTNVGVMDVTIDQIDAGNQVHVPGGTQELVSMVDDAARLKEGKAAQTGELLGFSTWREVQECATTDEGVALKALVGLVDRYGCSALRGVLTSILQTAEPGCVTVSTAHKAKGLEWIDVELHSDFMRSGKPSMAERRLFYVASTRAKSDLFVSEALAKPFLEEGIC